MTTTEITPPPFFSNSEGVRFKFVRKAYKEKDGSIPLSQLADDEIVVYPGDIYRRIP